MKVDLIAHGAGRGVDLVSKLCQQSGYEEGCGFERKWSKADQTEQEMQAQNGRSKADLGAIAGRWIGRLADWARR